ncbi:hypothetical protein CEP53_015106 [Fusarium sp. AF-6]|nr:hypothetical protein CEP53_015106 [Fusarium sp. AF-6]
MMLSCCPLQMSSSLVTPTLQTPFSGAPLAQGCGGLTLQAKTSWPAWQEPQDTFRELEIHVQQSSELLQDITIDD